MLVYQSICWLFLYSVIGWLYETILCSVTERKWVNRGFLNGPYCPIYGFGALLCVLLLDKTQNPIVLFYLGMVTACSLEYFTSWLMEKLFMARWWDYSTHKYNLNGRISLAGALVFGTFSVLLVRFAHPWVVHQTEVLPDHAIVVSALLIALLFLVDCTVTVMTILGFNKKLQLADLKIQIDEFKLQVSEIKELISRLTLQEKRLLRAFPKLKSVIYDDALQIIKEDFSDKLRKTKEQLRKYRQS